MGQEDDPEATTIGLASLEEEEEEEEEEAVVITMIHHHHMITILRLRRLQHVQHHERLMHQLKRVGDQASGLERWVVPRRDIWREIEVRISNLELSVRLWAMGGTIMGRGVRDGVVGRAQDQVGVLALALGLGPVGMRARALGGRVGGECWLSWGRKGKSKRV